MADTEVQLFVMDFGRFKKSDVYPDLPVGAEVDRMSTILSRLGASRGASWATPMEERSSEAVVDRLSTWAESPTSLTVLYWLGHGWSNGKKTALVHWSTPKYAPTNGVTPDALATQILAWAQRSPAPPGIVVVIDACKSGQFAKELYQLLDNGDIGIPMLIVGTSTVGSITLGVFSRLLADIIDHVFNADTSIRLSDLADAIEQHSIPTILPRDLNIASVSLPIHRSATAPSPVPARGVVVGASAEEDAVVSTAPDEVETLEVLEPLDLTSGSAESVTKQAMSSLRRGTFDGAVSSGLLAAAFHDYPGTVVLHARGLRRAADRRGVASVLRTIAAQPGTTVFIPARAKRVAKVTRALCSTDDLATFAVLHRRLTTEHVVGEALLLVLALARGSGVPLVDGIWYVLANGLLEGSPASADLNAASRLLEAAGRTVAVDRQDEQTVYRCARSDYARYIVDHATRDRPEVELAMASAGLAFLEATRERDSVRKRRVNPYLSRYLLMHARYSSSGGRELRAPIKEQLEARATMDE